MRERIIMPLLLSLLGTLHCANIDKGLPSMENLYGSEYVERQITGLDKIVAEEDRKIRHMHEVFDEEMPSTNLEDTIAQEDINKLNLNNVYSLNELEAVGKVFYRNGELLRSGFVKIFYENIDSPKPLIKEIMEVKDGYVEGEIREYFVSGRVSKRYFYINNLKEGECSLYKRDGSLFENISYSKGKKEGLRTVYGKNGLPLFEIMYKEDVVDGYIREFFPNGGRKRYSEYNKNQKEGVEVSYDNSGRVVYTAEYNGGKLDGLYTEFYPDGEKRIREIAYIEGKPQSMSVFTRDGRVKSVVSLLKEEDVQDTEDGEVVETYSDEYLVITPEESIRRN